MSILCDRNSKLIVQGMGRMGQFHARLSIEYGTQVVGGVHPGKGGSEIEGIPIFNTVREAVEATEANASVIFVPPPGAADAILEAADAGLDLAVCITEGIPALDMALAMRERMAVLAGDWRKLGHRLGFGVGISLGYATVGMVGFEGRYDYTANGSAVNLAARLCDEADDGEILLSTRAYTAVEDRVAASSPVELTLKGFQTPVEVFRLGA